MVSAPTELTILEESRLRANMDTWRVRLHFVNGNGTTVYIRRYNVMGWTGSGAGPIPYDQVARAQAEGFDKLLKTLPKRLAPPLIPLAAQLTASDLDLVREQIARCWNIHTEAHDAIGVVEIHAQISADGRVTRADIVNMERANSDPLFRAAAESARRAFFNPMCMPLKLPADKYAAWKDLVIDFDLSGVR